MANSIVKPFDPPMQNTINVYMKWLCEFDQTLSCSIVSPKMKKGSPTKLLTLVSEVFGFYRDSDVGSFMQNLNFKDHHIYICHSYVSYCRHN